MTPELLGYGLACAFVIGLAVWAWRGRKKDSGTGAGGGAREPRYPDRH